MLIPARPLRRWAVVPGTETTFADAVPVKIGREAFESSAATVLLAYAGSPEPAPGGAHGVRLDFRWVVHLGFSGFSAEDPSDLDLPSRPFSLNVVDAGPMLDRFLSGYREPDWSLVFGDRTPSEVFRHFRISFDDFGTFDVLAADGVARMFPLTAGADADDGDDGAVAEARAEALLLADALALEPPLLSWR